MIINDLKLAPEVGLEPSAWVKMTRFPYNIKGFLNDLPPLTNALEPLSSDTSSDTCAINICAIIQLDIFFLPTVIILMKTKKKPKQATAGVNQKAQDDLNGVSEKTLWSFHSDAVESTIRDLQNRISNGETQALDELFQLAVGSVDALNLVAKQTPSLILPISRKKLAWPIVCTLRKKNIILFLESIELGKNHPFDLSSALRNRTTIKDWTVIFVRVIDVLRIDYQSKSAGPNDTEQIKQIRKLPVLNDNSVDQWFEVIWYFVMGKTEQCPEKDKLLRAVGIDARAKHSTPLAREKIIRDNIKRRFKQTLKTVAPLGDQ